MRWAGKQAVVTLPEDIDLSNAGQIREQLLTVINRGPAVLIVDMTATMSCDYAGAEAMIRAYQRAVPSGTDLRLVVTAQIVRRVLSYNGLDRFVSIYPSLEAAQAVRTPAEVLGLAPRPASARADGQAPPRGSTTTGSQLPPARPSDRNRAAVRHSPRADRDCPRQIVSPACVRVTDPPRPSNGRRGADQKADYRAGRPGSAASAGEGPAGPAAPFGPGAAASLVRGDSRPHAPGLGFADLRTVAFDGLDSLKVPGTSRNRV